MESQKPLKETLHEEAKKQSKTYIDQIVTNFPFSEGKSHLDNATYDLITKITKIIKKDCLEFIEIYLFLRKEILDWQKSESQKDVKDFSGTLQNLLPAESIIRLQESIFNKYLLLPENYEVMIPLRNVQLPHQEALYITENIKIASLSKEIKEKYNNKSNIFWGTPTPPKEGTTYLMLNLQGYANEHYGIGLLNNALKISKQLIAAFVVDKVLKPNDSISPFTPFGRLPEDACLINPLLEGEELYSVELSNIESSFIRKLELNPKILDVPPLETLISSGKNLDSPEEKHRRLQKKLDALKRLFSKNTNLEVNNENKRVKTSLEWFFDGLCNENMTFSFIQFSIALEALLGDTKEKEKVVERLADRCSFLIAKNSIERKGIRQKFQEAYGVRSKIIHKGETKLNEKDQEHYMNMKELLERSLSKEIQNLPPLPRGQ